MADPLDGTADLKIARRHLPHWVLEGSTYFVTARVATSPLSATERRHLLNQIRHGDGQYYGLVAVVIMPDHMHLLLKPHPNFTLSRITKGIKGTSARWINRRRGTSGAVWLHESWDHIVRNENELLEKIHYMFHNPVKAGFADELSLYEGWYWSGKDGTEDDA